MPCTHTHAQCTMKTAQRLATSFLPELTIACLLRHRRLPMAHTLLMGGLVFTFCTLCLKYVSKETLESLSGARPMSACFRLPFFAPKAKKYDGINM